MGEVSDEHLKIKIKHDCSDITQRKKNGKEIEVYVYKYIDDTESIVWINNMTQGYYRERQVVESDNLLYPFRSGKNYNFIELKKGEDIMIRMKRKDNAKSGDFE